MQTSAGLPEQRIALAGSALLAFPLPSSPLFPLLPARHLFMMLDRGDRLCGMRLYQSISRSVSSSR